MKTLVTLLTFLALSVAVSAKPVDFNGCTLDKKAVVLAIDIDDQKLGASKHIQAVFFEVAAKLSADELSSGAGYRAFMTALSDTDKDAINTFYGPPQVTGECK